MSAAPLCTGPRLASLVLAASALLLALATPTWLQHLLPAQQHVMAWASPDLQVHTLTLSHTPWRLTAQVSTRRHEVLQGRVWPPGMVWSAHTPARVSQKLLVVCCAALAWLLWQGPRLGLRRGLRRHAALWAALASWALAWAVASAPLILVGQLWAMGLGGQAETTWYHLLARASSFLLHGGDVLLCALPFMALWAHGVIKTTHKNPLTRS
jgi:hypothetical protein